MAIEKDFDNNNENAIEWLTREHYATCTFTDRKMINRVKKLYEDRKDELLEIFGELEKTGKQDMVFEFCSTSKVSLAGAGIAAIAASVLASNIITPASS